MSTPIVTTKYPKCQKCGYPDVNIEPSFFLHKDICDYLIFRDKEAPARGLKNVVGGLPSIKIVDELIIPALDEMNIPHFSYKIHGLNVMWYDIFVQEDVANAIILFFRTGGYAGMSLEEYITKMVPNAS